jgi:pyruvate dehydrogenase E2 component (dihydrolipoamide acetyltransferase)
MSPLRALTMPKWGIEMVEGTVSDWSIAEGDRIVKGQSIALIETGKIANDVEAELDATVARLIAKRGETLPVGALLAVLATAPIEAAAVDEFVRGFRAAPGSTAATDETDSRDTRASTDSIRSQSTAATGAPSHAAIGALSSGATSSNIAISPAARALADERGIDIRTLRGSGRGGRISLQDVEQALKSAATAAAPDDGPVIERFSPMRKAIAQQLTLSKSTIPHFYLRIEVSVDALLSLRERQKESGEPAPGINAWLLRGAALALMEVPEVNVQVHGEEIHRFRHADIAVAVATERGLIAPIVRAAETKPVRALAEEVKTLAERARSGDLRAEEFTGGSFSVSNLGMYGIDEFDAIINPPQGAILAIGRARCRAAEAGSGLQFATTMKLSMSCDHRAIDGAVGARYLAALRDAIEKPERLAR